VANSPLPCCAKPGTHTAGNRNANTTTEFLMADFLRQLLFGGLRIVLQLS
jgi:hypothetical protein